MAYSHDANDITTVATSNSNPYVISANAELSADYAAWKAFDHLSGSGTNRGWFSGSAASGWIKIDLGSGNAKYITSAKINVYDGTAGSNMGLIFKGSNDDSNWTTLATPSAAAWTSDETKEFGWSNATAYRYIMIEVNPYPTNIGQINITEIELFETTGWAGKILNIVPGKVMGIARANIAKIMTK